MVNSELTSCNKTPTQKVTQFVPCLLFQRSNHMHLIFLLLCLTSTLLSGEIRELRETCTEATYLCERGLYGSALKRFNDICFGMCPSILEVEKKFGEMTEEEKKVFIEAWSGRLTCLALLGKVDSYHIREKRVLDRLNESGMRAVDQGEYTVLENVGELDDDELDEMASELIAKNVIESKDDMSYQDGQLTVKLKKDEPCCEDCGEAEKKKQE